MTTPKAKLAGLVLIAALCAGFTLGLTAPAWGDEDELRPPIDFLKMIQDAESIERGVAAYKRGDYATALREFRTLAEQGVAEAQFKLGGMYEKGQRRFRRLPERRRLAPASGRVRSLGGVPQDYAEAARWYRKAAEQGDARAQKDLGHMYFDGRGVPQDYAEAARWYRKAAEQGDARAQYSLGAMYNMGQGVLRDYAEAARWYRKAAEQGDTNSQYNLGFMYRKGRGVPQDYVRAYAWYDLAASSFPPGKGFDRAVKYRDLVAAKMTPAQIAEAQKLARK